MPAGGDKRSRTEASTKHDEKIRGLKLLDVHNLKAGFEPPWDLQESCKFMLVLRLSKSKKHAVSRVQWWFVAICIHGLYVDFFDFHRIDIQWSLQNYKLNGVYQGLPTEAALLCSAYYVEHCFFLWSMSTLFVSKIVVWGHASDSWMTPSGGSRQGRIA